MSSMQWLFMAKGGLISADLGPLEGGYGAKNRGEYSHGAWFYHPLGISSVALLLLGDRSQSSYLYGVFIVAIRSDTT
jgi:hypothetical protein